MEKKKNKPIISKILDNDDSGERPTRQAKRETALSPNRPASSFPGFVYANKLREKRIASYRRVVQEEKGLAEDFVGHQLAIGRLFDINTELETERLERRNRLRDAKRESGLADKLDRLADLDIQEQIKRKEKSINELNSDKANSKIERLKQKINEEAIINDIKTEVEIRKAKAKLWKALEKELSLDQAFEEFCHEIFGGKTPEELDEKSEEAFNRLKDIFDGFED